MPNLKTNQTSVGYNAIVASFSLIAVLAVLLLRGDFIPSLSARSLRSAAENNGDQRATRGRSYTEFSLQLRKLEESKENLEENSAWAYSKYATIVPDPEFHMDDSSRAKLADEYGSWHFWDDAENDRPEGDYAAKYPLRDVPNEAWDDAAWQVDAVFVNHILDSGQELVSRAQEAIYSEYGYSSDLSINEKLERNKMFYWEKVSTRNPDSYPSAASMLKGGWTTTSSVEGLVRRLLHAVMTNDEFVVVVVGGPSVTGAGNHFRQSWPSQMHRVLAPVLARLGVKLVTRNLSHRHSGSVPIALGVSTMSSILSVLR